MTLPTPCVRPAVPQSSTTETPCVSRHNVEGPGRLRLDQSWDGRASFVVSWLHEIAAQAVC